MRKNLILILLSLFVATWAVGQTEKTLPTTKIDKATTAIDLSDFNTKPIVENSSTRSGLNEGFEGTLFPPVGWKVIDGGSIGQTWEIYTSSPISGNASAAIRYHSSQAHDDWLITPPLLPVAGNDTISFLAKQGSNNYQEKFNVMLSTTGNNKEDFTITLASNIGPAGTTVETFEYVLSEYHGDTVYFAIQAISTNQLRLYVDNFVGPEIFTSPTDLAVKGENRDYRLIPICQLNSALTFVTNVQNNGAALTENVNVIATVKDVINDATVFTTTDVLSAGLGYGEIQTISAAVPFNATTLPVGNYQYVHTADYAADYDQTDNTDVFNFSVTNDVYARDAGVFQETGFGFNYVRIFGNLFDVYNEATITGVQLVWPATLPEVTAPYQLALYKVDGSSNMYIEGAPIFQTDTYERDQSQAGQTVNIPVRPTVIQPGFYVLAIKQTSNTNILIARDEQENGFALRTNSGTNPTRFNYRETGGFLSLRMDFTPRSIVTFNISDGTNPIGGANVTVKQGETIIGTAVSNAAGVAEIYASAGNYTYSVTAIGYLPHNDVPLVVSTDDMAVDLVMNAAPPTLEVTPTTFTFAATQIETSTAPQTFTMQNIGGDTLVVNPSDITIVGANADQFALTTIENPDTLATGETATFTVVFSPTTVGEKTATINVNSTAGSKTVAISGNAIDLTITEFPYYETFDGEEFPPLGWLSLGAYKWERVTTGGNPSCSPFGAAMLRYNAWSIPSGNQGTLVTRRLNMSSGNYGAGFKIYRDLTQATKAERVDVYVNTSPDTVGATLIGTVHRCMNFDPVVTEAGWYDYAFNIPAGYVGNLSHVILVATSYWGANIFVDEFVVGHASTVTLVANPSEGGTVSGGGTNIIGTEVILKATPNASYKFVNWTNEANEVVSTTATFTHVVGATDVTLTANFEQIYPVVFTVIDSDSIPIVGANILIDEALLTTNTSGIAKVELANGTHPYTVFKHDLANVTGNAVVNSVADTINVTMQLQISAPFDVTAGVINVNQAKVEWNPSFNDDIESYEDFIIDSIGNYTLVDVDGATTSYTISGYTFPNANYAGTYIVFNPSATTPPLEDPNWAAHGGNKYLACFAAHLSYGGPNNDWLITPQVTVVPGMRFSFWAKSATASYIEDFRVAVSTTDADVNSFAFLTGGNPVQPPATEWTQYTYGLDGFVGEQIYLAINCVSVDKFAFMVDDIFIGGPRIGGPGGLLGYKVYLNDQEVATDLTEPVYTIIDLPVGTHTIGVRSVYSHGVSEIVYADPITIEPEVYDPATNVQAVVEGSNVNITWDAPAKGRDNVILSESFDSGSLPTGWTTIDADGDGYNWTWYPDGKDLGNRQAKGTRAQCMMSESSVNIDTTGGYNWLDLTPNNYLITPLVAGATKVTYNVGSLGNQSWCQEYYAVCASTTGTNEADFQIVMEEQVVYSSGTASIAKEVVLPVGTKYVAFRHFNCEGKLAMVIDDVVVYGEAANYTYTITRSGEEIATGITETSYTDENVAEGTYEYCVLVVYPGGTSEPACADPVTVGTTHVVTFTVVDTDNNPIEDVSIEVDLVTLTTDASGVATVNLVNGEYTYTATKAGYADYEGSFTVNNEALAVSITMTVGIEGIAENHVRLYPNPVGSSLTIERENSDEVVIEIYNINGALVGTTKTEKATTTVDVGRLSSGSYFIRIIGANDTSIHRFIKH